VFGLFVLGGSKDAIDTILDISEVFTVLLLSDHDGNSAIEQPSGHRSDRHSHRKYCNGLVLIQQAFPRRGQGEFVATIRVDVYVLT
jgi:hypothetical protein